MAPNVIHWFGAFMLFASMALLVVVSVRPLLSRASLSRERAVTDRRAPSLFQVSAPIWDTVGYLKGNVNGVSTTWGNWGMCTANGCSSATLG